MRILAAEDNPVFQNTLRNLLTQWGYEVVIASDGERASRELQGEDPPHIAILDWMMPGLDGVQVCRQIRSLGREPYIYILLVTARTDPEDLVEAIEAGADDYLTKPVKTLELRARLRAGRRIVDLQQQLLMAREALREQATHDGLTGLLNRSAVVEVLERELERASRERAPLSVLMVDLDHFKRVNDTLGHLAGDAVLREAAARMKSAVRRYDLLGRYGGEEFLVVLPGCAAQGATTQAERLRLALAAEPFSLPGQPFAVTCSIGVASLTGENGDSDTLIREADVRLYQAKNMGRNCVAAALASAAPR